MVPDRLADSVCSMTEDEDEAQDRAETAPHRTTVRVHLGPATDPTIERALVGAGAELVDVGDAEALVVSALIGADELRALLHPWIRWVSLPVAGVDGYLVQGALDRERTWTATKGVYRDGVAEHAVALLLACSRRLPQTLRQGRWAPRVPGWRLRGTTIAIFGTGGIGASTAAMLHAFGAHCLGVNRTGAAAEGFDETVPLERRLEALERSRAAILALASTPLTTGVIGRGELEALGPEGVLVNVARGELVDQDALVDLLASGGLGGAGLDVTVPEPLPDGHPLWSLPTVLVTPHVANPSLDVPWRANLDEYAEHLARNVRAYAAGGPLEGVVDLDLGY